MAARKRGTQDGPRMKIGPRGDRPMMRAVRQGPRQLGDQAFRPCPEHRHRGIGFVGAVVPHDRVESEERSRLAVCTIERALSPAISVELPHSARYLSGIIRRCSEASPGAPALHRSHRDSEGL